MKRLIALLLIALLLCGCSVSIPASITGKNQTKPTEPVDIMSVELIQIDSWAQDTGLVLHVCIDKNKAFKQDKNEVGTEFEMVLNMYHCVLEINPLGQKAETLLAGSDFSGVFYQTAMTDILTLAQKQQMIESSTIITVSATAVGTDSWTVASYNILERPIEIFRQDSGVFFDYKINAAGGYLDEKEYTKNGTDGTDITEETLFDGTPYLCYWRQNGAGMRPEFSIISRPDGTIEEQYLPNPGDPQISLSYHPDGSFSFGAAYTDNLDIHYTVYPDGTFVCNSRFHIDGIKSRQRIIQRNGDVGEIFYDENGNLIPAPNE